MSSVWNRSAAALIEELQAVHRDGRDAGADSRAWLEFAVDLHTVLGAQLEKDVEGALLAGVPAEYLATQVMGYAPGETDRLVDEWHCARGMASQDWLIANLDRWVGAVERLLAFGDRLVTASGLTGDKYGTPAEQLERLAGLVRSARAEEDNLHWVSAFAPWRSMWWRQVLPLAEQPEDVHAVLVEIRQMTTEWREAAGT